MLPLRELQLQFLAALAPPEAAMRDSSAERTLLELVNGRGALGPAERLEIYADMYRSRLIDVLREDFPRLAALLGDSEFAALACRYLARHPSTHASVRHVGRAFAHFLAAEAAVPPYLADLARLEWARVEVFDAPDAETLHLSDLTSAAPPEWPALRFRPIPACRLVESAWPVHEIWDVAEAPVADRQRDWSRGAFAVRVWREGWSVSHAAMGLVEQRSFRLLQQGEPFARLCAAVGDDLDADGAAREVGGLLARWIADGLLARVMA